MTRRDPHDVLAAWDGWKVGGPHAPDAIDLAAALRETLAEASALRSENERLTMRVASLKAANNSFIDIRDERDEVVRERDQARNDNALLRAQLEGYEHPVWQTKARGLEKERDHLLAENERLRVKRERQTEHERKRLHDEQNAHAEIYDELLAAADALHAENLQLRSQLARAEAVIAAARREDEANIRGFGDGPDDCECPRCELHDKLAAYDQEDKP